MIPRSPDIEPIVWALGQWRELFPEGATLDTFARSMVQLSVDTLRVEMPTAEKEKEYCRAYCLSIDLACRGLLHAGAGSPTRFTPIKPWYSKEPTS